MQDTFFTSHTFVGASSFMPVEMCIKTSNKLHVTPISLAYIYQYEQFQKT